MSSRRQTAALPGGLRLAFALALALGLLEGPRIQAAAENWPGLTFHAAPKPLPESAVTSDWPRFLGPNNTPVSPETKLAHTFGPEGPAKVWEVSKGEGYACPAIAGGKLVLFHRVGDRETIECLDPETGKRFWTHGYPIVYRDRYGYSSGPRASPVIDDGRVFVFGVTSVLTCLDLETGKVLWQRDCAKEDGVPKFFFGSGATPLVQGDLLVCDLGGANGRDVAGFDKKTGEPKWFAKTGWKQSYASPIPVTLGGQPRVLVFQGGEGEESMASTGGLVSLEPTTGKVLGSFFWRATRYTSVNASTPVLCGPGRVFISQAYVDSQSPCNGGAMLALAPDGSMTAVWKNPSLGCHWMTPVFHDGHLYAFSGEKDRTCELVCHDATTGENRWRLKLEHEIKLANGRPLVVGFLRGSLLRADGAFLCLGEWGTLAWLDLSPKGCEKKATAQLFTAPAGAWTLPALSRGLLYVCQNEEDKVTGAGRRLICYDLRGQSPSPGS